MATKKKQSKEAKEAPPAATDMNMDPREPYPTGSPPDPREAFRRIHGHYPDEGGEA